MPLELAKMRLYLVGFRKGYSYSLLTILKNRLYLVTQIKNACSYSRKESYINFSITLTHFSTILWVTYGIEINNYKYSCCDQVARK